MPDPKQAPNEPPSTDSQHWWERLFRKSSQNDLPAPPAPPPLPSAWELLKPGGGDWAKTGMWDPSMAAAWDSANTGNRSLADIGGTMYNENKGLRPGDPKRGFANQQELDRGSLAIGHVILNASRKGLKPSYVAPSQITKNDQTSPIYQHYLQLARQAFEENSRGVDPTGGRTEFNHRFNDYRGPRIMNGKPEPFVESIGPFKNAGSKVNPTARIVIYDDAKNPATTKKTRKR